MDTISSLPILLSLAYVCIQCTTGTPIPDLLKSQQTSKEPSLSTEISTNLTEYQFAHGWLHNYGYITEIEEFTSLCTKCLVEECDTGCLQILKAAISEPLIKYKQAYGFINADGVLNDEVLKLMNEKRCQRPDYDTTDASDTHRRVKRYTKLTNFSWDLKRTPVLTISFRKYLPQFSIIDQQRMVLECASLWAAPTALTFQLKDFGPDTNIAIDFRHVDGPWKSLGTGQSPNYNPPGYSYMNLDVAEPWKLNKAQNGAQRGVSFKWSVCHEMGHNLNLGHSNVREAIMFPTGHGQDESRLSNDDLRGITSLYGGPNGQTVIGSGAAILAGGGQPPRRTNPPPRRTQPPPKRRTGRRATNKFNRRNRKAERKARRSRKLVAPVPQGQQMRGVVPEQRPNPQIQVRQQVAAPGAPPQPSQHQAPPAVPSFADFPTFMPIADPFANFFL